MSSINRYNSTTCSLSSGPSSDFLAVSAVSVERGEGMNKRKVEAFQISTLHLEY